MRHTNVSLRQAGMINLFQALDFILSRISALSEGRFPLVLCSSLNMLDDDAGVHTLFFPLTQKNPLSSRSRSPSRSHQKMPHLNSTTRPSLFLIVRPTKKFVHGSQTHQRPISLDLAITLSLWSFLNAPVLKRLIRTSGHLVHHVVILSLKQFSRRPPRHQSPQSEMPRQLSHNGTLLYLLWLTDNWCSRPKAKQWTMTPKPRALSPTYKRAICSNLSN
ncbi:hypothetical protein TNCV_3617891 [Trichonephila clavipes]|nr:hypothetical protein TNCV_3617891 [Trichonephila clavipes]